MRRSRKPALSDFLRDCSSLFCATVAAGARHQPDPAGRSAIRTCDGPVTDSSTPDHPILGANVAFDTVVSRPAPAPLPISIGGIVITRNPAQVIVSSSRSSVLSDISGLATLQPFLGAAQGPTLIQGSSAAGISTISFSMQSLRPVQQASPGASPGASLRGTGAAGTSLTNLDRPQPRP